MNALPQVALFAPSLRCHMKAAPYIATMRQSLIPIDGTKVLLRRLRVQDTCHSGLVDGLALGEFLPFVVWPTLGNSYQAALRPMSDLSLFAGKQKLR